MYQVGYRDNVEFVVLGTGATIALALQDAASTLVDDVPVNSIATATKLLDLLCKDCTDLQITYIADAVQKDGVAMYLQP